MMHISLVTVCSELMYIHGLELGLTHPGSLLGQGYIWAGRIMGDLGVVKKASDNYETMTWKSKFPSLRFLVSNILATLAPKCKIYICTPAYILAKKSHRNP